MIPIIGLVSMNTSFAYDDIYASTQKGGQVYAEKSQKNAEKKAQKKERKERKNVVIIKSPNLERYDLVADEFLLVIDTTIKSTDDYVMDTIRILGVNGELEKTLMLKTKEKQNVYFDNNRHYEYHLRKARRQAAHRADELRVRPPRRAGRQVRRRRVRHHRHREASQERAVHRSLLPRGTGDRCDRGQPHHLQG